MALPLKRDARLHLAESLGEFVDGILAGLSDLGGSRLDIVDRVAEWFIAGHRKKPTGRDLRAGLRVRRIRAPASLTRERTYLRLLRWPYDQRPAPESAEERPPYQGANPVSDLWSQKALEYGGKYLRRAVENGQDVEARGAMALAASLSGVGFGSAGVHIPHSCSYPIAGLKHDYQPPASYPQDHKFVPHGWSVIVTAPAAFRFTYQANPERHREVAQILSGKQIENADENTLPDIIIQLMKDVGAPRGIRDFGYDEDDIDDLVEGTVKQ